MVVEPGFRRAAAVLLLPPAGQRRQHDFQAGLLPHSAGDLVAVHPRHPDVQEHHVRR